VGPGHSGGRGRAGGARGRGRGSGGAEERGGGGAGEGRDEQGGRPLEGPSKVFATPGANASGFGSGPGFGTGFTGTLLLARAALPLATLLSHTIPLPRVHLCVVV